MSDALIEGCRCPIPGCGGMLEMGDVADCSCHVSPPCSRCENNRLTCQSCGFDGTEPKDTPAMSEPKLPGLTAEPWLFTRFAKPDGTDIRTVDDINETLAHSAKYAETAELWGVSIQLADENIVVCYTGNGPNSEVHASVISQVPAMLASISDLTARLAVAEAERDAIIRAMTLLVVFLQGEHRIGEDCDTPLILPAPEEIIEEVGQSLGNGEPSEKAIAHVRRLAGLPEKQS